MMRVISSIIYAFMLSILFFLIRVVGYDWVHLTTSAKLGAHYTSPGWEMSVELSVAGEAGVHGGNLSQCNSLHHKSNSCDQGWKSGRCGEKTSSCCFFSACRKPRRIGATLLTSVRHLETTAKLLSFISSVSHAHLFLLSPDLHALIFPGKT
jgi:hypothetical protein